MEKKRLNELLKQRALIEEHLTWLDAEIEVVQNQFSVPLASKIPVNRLPQFEATFGRDAEAVALPEPDPTLVAADIYNELGPDTKVSANEARKGCIGFFAFGFLALAALAVWVWIKY